MNKYNGLLLTVSDRYLVQKGDQEAEDEWKTRLIYSICGMMAYASLWDEDVETISILHLKQKIRIMLASYKSMYPELFKNLPYFPEELEDEISNQFLNTGVVYHRPNRIAPSMKREEPYSGILFQRGIALDSISGVSGIGFYSRWEGATHRDGIKAMFGLEQKNLQKLWRTTLSVASWKRNPSFECNTEYLRLKPPFSHGYWVSKPDMSGFVSILRTGIKGAQLYYLYRYTDTLLEVSPLPHWQVDAYNYRTIACACLLTYGTLPPIEYFSDGPLVHIRMNYLLPPHELNFLKLYSWPETCASLPCDFKRKLSAEVFSAIRNILFDEGYKFEERGTI